MKSKFFHLLLLSVFGLRICAAEELSMLFPYEARNGEKYQLMFDPKILESSPVWDPATEEAPISIHQAVALATPTLKSVGLKKDQAALEEIKVDYFLLKNLKFCWFYVITFRERVDFLTQSPNDVSREKRIPVMVLMSGKVIPPKHEG